MSGVSELETGGIDPDTGDNLSLSAGDRLTLGNLRSVHRMGSKSFTLNLICVSVFVLLTWGAMLWFAKLELLGPPGKQMWIGVAISGVLALFPTIGLIDMLRKRKWRLYVFANGFVLLQGRELVVPWAEIADIYERSVSVDRWFVIVIKNAKKLKVRNLFDNFEAFSGPLRENVTRLTIAEASEVFPKGGSLTFNDVTVSMHQLGYKSKSVRWEKVEGIAIERRSDSTRYFTALVVRIKDPKAKTGVSEWMARPMVGIPNLDAFLHIVSSFKEIQPLKE